MTVHVTIIDEQRHTRPLDAHEGDSLMATAVSAQVAGIFGDCNGIMSCGTCVVTVPDRWLAKLPPRSDHETEVLAFMDQTSNNARLSCQINVTEALRGMVVEIMPA